MAVIKDAMKTKSLLLVLFTMLGILVGCKKEDEKTPTGPSCVGEWELTDIAVKSVTYAGQEVSVYLAFLENGNFELYQMVGQGRYRKYTGTWTLEGTTLSGKYSSKKAWGSSYEISRDNDKLVLTSAVSGEADTYKATSIPENVKSAAFQE